jgi:hypothetical protein
VTREPQQQNGDVGENGNDQWQGQLSAYVDGALVASNTAALYSANLQVPEDGGDPADLAIGCYNAASTLGNNPYEGDVDELAIYNNYVLKPEQILAHYQAGTSAAYGTNYETLVLTAPFAGTQRSGPKTYLRFNDPARFPVANSGTLGAVADGSLLLTTNVAAGPQPSAYPGFDASNLALPLDGAKQWASLNNPAGLNIAGQITLEAWVKPDTTQTAELARIVSHGPQTVSSFVTQGWDFAPTNTTEVYLAIDGTGANYVVGSREIIDGTTTNSYGASFAIPAGDLGGADWIHLVGVYDGAKWRLYRNGVEAASAAATVGALAVDQGSWAIGATGNGWADPYAGSVDEVAIYAKALTPNQVAAHYQAGKSAAVTAFTIKLSGSNVTITWPAGATLQEAAAVTGPFADVAGNPASPLSVPATGTKFYRYKQ